MRMILELLRVIFILLILMAIFDAFFENLYLWIGNGAEKYSWLSLIASFILIFVLYRNKFQFSGLITSSVILILLPPIIAHIN